MALLLQAWIALIWVLLLGHGVHNTHYALIFKAALNETG